MKLITILEKNGNYCVTLFFKWNMPKSAILPIYLCIFQPYEGYISFPHTQ